SDITLTLTQNINMAGRLMLPIGYGFEEVVFNNSLINTTDNNVFYGRIDGQSNSISGLTIMGTDTNVGLFGTVLARYNPTPFASNITIKDSVMFANSKLGTSEETAGVL